MFTIYGTPPAPTMSESAPPLSEIGLNTVVIGGSRVSIRERTLIAKPFGRLLHFETDDGIGKPRTLIVAPLSGMRSEMLYDMILGMLPDHDVHLLSWSDAADVPLECGPFGLDDNIAYLIDALCDLGAGVHVIGLCQSALPALAATSVLASSGNRARPATLTLIGGMLDTRIHPSPVEVLARSCPLDWFERYVIRIVPAGRVGHGRHVYPAEFERTMLSIHLFRHFISGGDLLHKMLHDDGGDSAQHPFSRLFFSVANIPAEFFLDTIACVFQEAALPRGQLAWRGTPVTPSAITDTGLLTIEGENDDISTLGQTLVAHDLCTGVPAERQAHFLCPEVGHFGLFHGLAWQNLVLPRMRNFILAATPNYISPAQPASPKHCLNAGY